MLAGIYLMNECVVSILSIVYLLGDDDGLLHLLTSKLHVEMRDMPFLDSYYTIVQALN